MAPNTDILAVVQDLSLCRASRDVMNVLRSAVRRLVGADGATVVLREGDLCYYADEDAIAPLWKGRRFPVSGCISGWSMLNRQQVAIRDIYADPRIPHDAYRPTFVKSLAMTPIRRADPMGAIGAYWADHHSATPDELELLQALGDSASIAFANVQLLESLGDANRRKDAFLAMLAHELRNPLGPIRSAAHLIRSHSPANDATERATEVIERQIGHLTRVVDDLLDAAQLTGGGVTIDRKRLDLAALLRSVTSDVKPLFDDAGLTLECTLGDAPVWVMGDATRLAQVFGKLLDNARKFTQRGGRVTLELSSDSHGYATVRVRDTGVGIDPAQLGAIFEAFAQTDTSLDRSRGGLGLGLAIAKALVGLHGGTITADSPGSGGGAEMAVRLPAAEELPAVASEPAPRTAPSRRERVLVVEDNRDAAHMLRELLEFSGFDVSVAYTGPDGITAARSERPAAVVCDIGLPGADGYVVAATLRADPATSAARLIAVTGYGSDEDRRRALNAGFDAHLVKPVPPPVLLQQLTKAVPALRH